MCMTVFTEMENLISIVTLPFGLAINVWQAQCDAKAVTHEYYVKAA